jgi:hypothetical protein
MSLLLKLPNEILEYIHYLNFKSLKLEYIEIIKIIKNDYLNKNLNILNSIICEIINNLYLHQLDINDLFNIYKLKSINNIYYNKKYIIILYNIIKKINLFNDYFYNNNIFNNTHLYSLNDVYINLKILLLEEYNNLLFNIIIYLQDNFDYIYIYFSNIIRTIINNSNNIEEQKKIFFNKLNKYANFIINRFIYN